jgi:hypothetical protein
MVRDARLPARLLPVLITSGHTMSHPDGCTHLPKKELASVLQVLLQTGRLKVARSLPLAGVLEKDLASFKSTVTTTGKDAVENWREREHDDLVLAVALAPGPGTRWFPMSCGKSSNPCSRHPSPAASDTPAASPLTTARPSPASSSSSKPPCPGRTCPPRWPAAAV